MAAPHGYACDTLVTVMTLHTVGLTHKGLMMIQAQPVEADTRMHPKPDSKSRTHRLQLVAPPAWVDLVEEWRAQQRPVPNMSAAIRRLVEMGLASEGQSTVKATPPKV